MKILSNYILNDIKLNKKRTIGTIVSIALSTMLILLTLIMANSLYLTLKNDVIAINGSQHETFYNISKEKAEELLSREEISDYFITQQKGYSKIEDSKSKPYICLVEYDDKALNNFGVNIIEGRLPENSNEIIITNELNKVNPLKYMIGSSINLSLNRIFINGKVELTQTMIFTEDFLNNNKITEEFISSGEYKIVGIIKKQETNTEQYRTAGYTAVAKLETINEKANYSVRYKDVFNAYGISDKIHTELNITGMMNTELLNYEGAFKRI